jgi:hypothetical protein
VSDQWRQVARGLKIARVALVLTVACAALFAGLVLMAGIGNASDYLRNNYLAGVALAAVLVGLGLTAVAAVVLGFVARCRCLATPADRTAARARVRLAVLLETCGWVSLAANVMVGVGTVTKVLPLPTLAVPITGGFSLLLLVVGRVIFFWYTRSLAESFDAPLARLPALSIALLLTWVGGAVAGFTVYQLGNFSVAPPALAFPTSYALFSVAGVAGVAGQFVYGRLLGRLAAAVGQFNVVPPPPSDRAYRERYLAGGGSDADA